MPAMVKAHTTSTTVTRDSEMIRMVLLADAIVGIARPKSHDGEQVT